MMNRQIVNRQSDRRLGALCGAAAAALLWAGAASAQQQLTVVSFGGAYQDGQSKALFQPAAKALGITVKEETYSGIADLRLKVKAGAVTWALDRFSRNFVMTMNPSWNKIGNPHPNNGEINDS